jgi:hypothetical protein
LKNKEKMTMINEQIPNTGIGQKYEPISNVYSHNIAAQLPCWYAAALKYVWRSPRKGKKKSLRKAAGALREILKNIEVYGEPPTITPFQAGDYWGVLKAFRADLAECGEESVHARLIVSVLDVILLHEAERFTMPSCKTRWSFKEGVQYAEKVLDAINLIESTSEKDLMSSKTAWEVGSDFLPF